MLSSTNSTAVNGKAVMTHSEKWIWSCDRSFPSNVDQGIELVKEVIKQMESAGWEESSTFGVHLAFEEALMNAIKHGNQLNPEKLVDTKINLSKSRIEITIRDEGNGFDPDSIPDPTAEENLENLSGRGVMLIRHFMDSVHFNDRCNQITMTKSVG